MVRWWKTTRSWMKPVGLGFDGWLQQECQHHITGCHSVKGVYTILAEKGGERRIPYATVPFENGTLVLGTFPLVWKLARGASFFCLSPPRVSYHSLHACNECWKDERPAYKFMIHFLIEKTKWSLNKYILKITFFNYTSYAYFHLSH